MNISLLSILGAAPTQAGPFARSMGQSGSESGNAPSFGALLAGAESAGTEALAADGLNTTLALPDNFLDALSDLLALAQGASTQPLGDLQENGVSVPDVQAAIGQLLQAFFPNQINTPAITETALALDADELAADVTLTVSDATYSLEDIAAGIMELSDADYASLVALESDPSYVTFDAASPEDANLGMLQALIGTMKEQGVLKPQPVLDAAPKVTTPIDAIPIEKVNGSELVVTADEAPATDVVVASDAVLSSDDAIQELVSDASDALDISELAATTVVQFPLPQAVTPDTNVSTQPWQDLTEKLASIQDNQGGFAGGGEAEQQETGSDLEALIERIVGRSNQTVATDAASNDNSKIASFLEALRTEGGFEIADVFALDDTEGADSLLSTQGTNSGSGSQSHALKDSASLRSSGHFQTVLTHTPVADQVLVTIRQNIQSGIDKVVIQLEPIELGRVEVQMDVSSDGLTSITITAETRDALDALQRDARILQKALQDVGIETDAGQMEFNLKQSPFQQAQDDARDQKGSGGAFGQDDIEGTETIEPAAATALYSVQVSDGLDIKV